jgi:tetratricopeptide (TPR) repeat protein
MLRPILWLSVFIVISVVSATAQRETRVSGQPVQGMITGQVRYADGNLPAFDVLVSCDSFSGGLIGQQNADRNGRFQFSNLAPAQYTITVRFQGYQEEKQTVDLLSTGTAYVQIRLKPDASGTNVSGARPLVRDANIPSEARKEFEKADEVLRVEKKESLQEGIRHLEKAITLYPKFLEAELKLGTAYMDLGQWDKAEQALRRALEIDPNAANAMFALGEIYLHQKKDEDAERILLQGLKVEDRSYQGHLTLGRVYWDMGSKPKDEAQWRPLLEKSYEQAKRVLELDPNLAAAHLLKGNLLLRVRRAPDALHEFEEYLRLDPKGPLAEQTRGVVEKIKKALAEQKN